MKNNIFIGWSGDLSKEIADILKKNIPYIIQCTNVFYSLENINSGDIWFNELVSNMEKSELGIFCLTKSNINNKWMRFESGFLSSQKKKAIPLLIDLKASELEKNDPFINSEACQITKEGFIKLCRAIVIFFGINLEEEIWKEALETRWEGINEILSNLDKNYKYDYVNAYSQEHIKLMIEKFCNLSNEISNIFKSNKDFNKIRKIISDYNLLNKSYEIKCWINNNKIDHELDKKFKSSNDEFWKIKKSL